MSGSGGIRRWEWAGAALLALLVLAVSQHHYVDRGDLPHGDVGEYVRRALRYRDFLVAGDLSGLFGMALDPQMHPPVHMLGMAAWVTVFGDTMAVTRAYGAVTLLVGASVLVWLGGLLGSPRSGLCAAVLTLLSLLHFSLAFTALTETTALVTTLVAIGALLLSDRSPGWSGALLAGTACFVAGMTRYNLFPMLLAPLFAWYAWEHRRDLRAASRPGWRLGWWIVPAALLLAWIAYDTHAVHFIMQFLVNKRPPQSLGYEGLAATFWVPVGLVRDCIVAPWVAIPVLLVATASLVPAVLDRDWSRRFGPVEVHLSTSPPLRLVQAMLLGWVAALSLHPYQLDRNLYGIVPLLYLCTFVSARGTRVHGLSAGAGTAATVTFLGLYSWHQLTQATQRRVPDVDYFENEVARGVLEMMGHYSYGVSNVLVAGWFRPLEPHQFELWMIERKLPARVWLTWLPGSVPDSERSALIPTMQTGHGRDLLSRDHVDDTAYVVIRTVGNTSRLEPPAAWIESNAVLVVRELGALGVPLVDQRGWPEAGVGVQIYRSARAGLTAPPATSPR